VRRQPVVHLLLLTLVLGSATPVGADEAADREQARDDLATAKIFLMEHDTPYFVGLIPELTEAVNRWLDAIAARDVEKILAFVLPEDEAYMRTALADPNDTMYQTFLADESPLYQLARSESRDFVPIRTGTRLNPGPGVDVCVFDRRRTDPRTDQERLGIFRNPDTGRVCQYFFAADGHWCFGYTSLTEGGPESYEPPKAGERP